MAKKTSTKKTVAKPIATTLVVPVVVSDIRNIAGDLNKVSNIPASLVDTGTKLVASIERYANRVAANLAGAGKKAEKDAAKVKRAEAKTKRDADKRTKKVAVRDALKAKLAAMEKELAS